MDEVDTKIETLVESMIRQMGRMPTEEEVMGFIFGDTASRLEILNNASKE